MLIFTRVCVSLCVIQAITSLFYLLHPITYFTIFFIFYTLSICYIFFYLCQFFRVHHLTRPPLAPCPPATAAERSGAPRRPRRRRPPRGPAAGDPVEVSFAMFYLRCLAKVAGGFFGSSKGSGIEKQLSEG